MRPFALVLRAGAVLVAVAFVFSLLIDGTPAPVGLKAKAASKPETVKTPTADRRQDDPADDPGGRRHDRRHR